MQQLFTLHQFNKLTEPEKFALLEDSGIYLEAHRYERYFKIALYALMDYYVEVWYNVKSKRVDKARAFVSYRKLDRFLKEIDISFLFV